MRRRLLFPFMLVFASLLSVVAFTSVTASILASYEFKKQTGNPVIKAGMMIIGSAAAAR